MSKKYNSDISSQHVQFFSKFLFSAAFYSGLCLEGETFVSVLVRYLLTYAFGKYDSPDDTLS